MIRDESPSQIQADERLVARGLDVVGRSGAEVIALMRVLHQRVLDSQGIGSVAPLIEFLQSNMDQSALRVSHVKIACARGCAHCCNRWVTVVAPEVIHVVKSLGARRAAAEAAVQQSLLRTRGKHHHERGVMVAACPLLGADAACTVYGERPLTCRTGTSLDAGACQRAYTEMTGEAVTYPSVFAGMRLGYSLALAGALRHAGLSHNPCEYHNALQRVMTQPQSEAQWLAGADIFAGLPQDPAGDPFQMPENRALFEAAFGFDGAG
jgi:hypothetical protein